MGCTPLRQPRSYAFMVCHACYSSLCRTCPYLRMALPLAAQGRISGREGRHTLCHPYRCRAPEEGRPRRAAGQQSGTDVARYLHAGDEAAHCRRDPGGQRFVPSGPHPHRADATCATRHKNLFVILRRIQQWKNGLIPLSTCRTSWPRCRPRILPTP